jgi:hypothetical protein
VACRQAFLGVFIFHFDQSLILALIAFILLGFLGWVFCILWRHWGTLDLTDMRLGIGIR